MTGSKSGGRKTVPRKTTSRKPTAPKPQPAGTAAVIAAGGKRVVAGKRSSAKPKLTKAELAEQAAEGQNVSESSEKTLPPLVTLAAGQNPSPVVVTSKGVETRAPGLSKKELIDEAVLRSGVKKKDAKPVVEALLAILGETVAGGRDLNLRPFGKLRVNRSEARSNGTVHMCRLRQPLDTASAAEETEGQE